MAYWEVFFLQAIPVVYAQGLAGDRWQLYAPWTNFLPRIFMDRVGQRLPARLLWQGPAACGQRVTDLLIYGGPLAAGRSAWWQGLRPGSSDGLVPSINLVGEDSRSRQRGRLLPICCWRQLWPRLTRQLQLYGDQLAVALAVTGAELPYWLAGIEGLARQVTVLVDERTRPLPLQPSGLAVRQLSYAVDCLEVDILIVSPALVAWLQNVVLRQDTVVVLTDGTMATDLVGCYSIAFDVGQAFPFPSSLLAEPADKWPLWEAILLQGYAGRGLGGWPSSGAARLRAMGKACLASGLMPQWELFLVEAD